MPQTSPAPSAPGAAPAIIRWVAQHIVPEEPAVRASLRRLGVAPGDVDDIIQDAYCRFAELSSTDHIERPGAYFMQTARNLWRDQLRRAAIIRFEDLTESARCFVEEESADVEATVAARLRLALVERLMAALPDRCRRIFTLKRVEGLSQRDIAQSLGVSESVVENDVQKALRLLQAALRSAETVDDEGADGHGARDDRNGIGAGSTTKGNTSQRFG